MAISKNGCHLQMQNFCHHGQSSKTEAADSKSNFQNIATSVIYVKGGLKATRLPSDFSGASTHVDA